MPIKDIPFTLIGDVLRPALALKIINPHTSQSYKTFGLIDTGGDECAAPADVAPLLGHNLSEGNYRQIKTGNGPSEAYLRTTKFEIYHPISEELIYIVDDIPVNFMPNLSDVLLGARRFLCKFVLTLNYPEHKFSLEYPFDFLEKNS